MVPKHARCKDRDVTVLIQPSIAGRGTITVASLSQGVPISQVLIHQRRTNGFDTIADLLFKI